MTMTSVIARFLLGLMQIAVILSYQETYADEAQSKAKSKSVQILVLGDSLTEGFGVEKDSAFPAVLQKRLRESGYAGVQVTNAGIGGSTSASGVSRLKWHLKNKPQIMIVALGANDGLRGLKIPESKSNISKVIDDAQSHSIQVVLAGMRLPPNYGKQYVTDFEKMYRDLAKKEGIPLIPFLLEGVAGHPEMNIEDGIHPNEKGHLKIAENVEKYLKPLLKQEIKSK